MKIIGIDPSFRKGGFAACVLDTEKLTAEFKILKTGILEFEDFVKENPFTYFSVENSNLQKSFFGKRKLQEAASVGKNQAVSQLAVGFILKHYTKDFLFDLSPKQKGAKIVNEHIFEAYSKEYSLINYKGSQDEKDAFKLAILAITMQKIRKSVIKQPEHIKLKKTRLK